MNGSEAEMIQDRREIVGWLTESPSRQSTGDTKAGALGRNDPQVPLDPGRPISSQGVTTARRSGNAQQG
jgi:hypothetical protein